MNKKLLLFLVLLISIVSVSCVSAADMDNDFTSDFSNSEESSDVEESYVEALQVPDGYVPDEDEENKDDIEFSEFLDTSDDVNASGDVSEDGDIASDDVNASGDVPSDEPSDDVNVSDDVPSDDVNVSDDVNATKNLPGTFDDLQKLIDNAAEGSTLNLDCDYYGKANSKIILNKDLTINGQGHIIDCKSAKNCYGFYSTIGRITLKNLSIINGHNGDNCKGGAIRIEGSAKYTIKNCIFLNNWADDYGGAIYNGVANTLILEDCVFRGNTADDDSGGAIQSKGGVEAQNTVFEKNKADDNAGAVFIDCDKYSSFKNCLFKSNVAGDDNGGAIRTKGELLVRDCTFDSNKAKVDGGAIFGDKEITVLGCVFKDNKAKGAKVHQCYGGAIRGKGTVNIDNSTFVGNVAEDYGGAVYAKNIYVNQRQSALSNFRGNAAKDNDGGALYAEDTVKVSYADFYDNYAYEDGGGIFCKNAYVDNSGFHYNNASGATFSKCEGGAIYAENDVNLYENCLFECNSAEYGGAIECDDLNIYDSSFVFRCNFARKVPSLDKKPIYYNYKNSSEKDKCFFKNLDFTGDVHFKNKNMTYYGSGL